MFTYIHIYIYIHIYTYIRTTCIHTHILTYIDTCLRTTYIHIYPHEHPDLLNHAVQCAKSNYLFTIDDVLLFVSVCLFLNRRARYYSIV